MKVKFTLILDYDETDFVGDLGEKFLDFLKHYNLHKANCRFEFSDSPDFFHKRVIVRGIDEITEDGNLLDIKLQEKENETTNI